MSSKEIPVEEARKTLGDLVIAAMRGETTILTRYGKPAAMITPYAQEPAMSTYALCWSILSDPAPDAEAVQPGEFNIDIPDEVLTWGAQYGLDQRDDVYLLVSDRDDAVPNEIAYMMTDATELEAGRVREAILERQEEHI